MLSWLLGKKIGADSMGILLSTICLSDIDKGTNLPNVPIDPKILFKEVIHLRMAAIGIVATHVLGETNVRYAVMGRFFGSFFSQLTKYSQWPFIFKDDNELSFNSYKEFELSVSKLGDEDRTRITKALAAKVTSFLNEQQERFIVYEGLAKGPAPSDADRVQKIGKEFARFCGVGDNESTINIGAFGFYQMSHMAAASMKGIKEIRGIKS